MDLFTVLNFGQRNIDKRQNRRGDGFKKKFDDETRGRFTDSSNELYCLWLLSKTGRKFKKT